MEGTERPLFSPTVWPGQPVPVPAVRRMTVQVREGGFLEYGDPLPPAEIPSELVLRELFDLDVLDAESLAAFSQEYGLLTALIHTPDGEPDPLAYLPTTETQWGAFATFQTAIHRFVSDHGVHPAFVVPHECAGLHARVMRALVRQWVAHEDGGEASALVTAWTSEGFTAPRSAWDAWRRWEENVNAAMRPMQVHVVVREEGDAWSRPWGTASPNAYTVMATQLVNFVAEGATSRRCASETCGRVFVRQRGRARYQGRTEGTMYCDRRCAKAQAERERRRRLRQGGKR
jgi:hypothetical protein